MKNKKTPLYVPILWFITTGIWAVTLCVDLYYQTTPGGLMVMHGLCIATSLAAAIANLIRYNKAKNQKED